MLEKIKYRLSDAEFIKRTRVRCIAAMTAVTIAVVTLLGFSLNTVKVFDGEKTYTVRSVSANVANILSGLKLKSEHYKIMNTKVENHLTTVEIAYSFPVFITAGENTLEIEFTGGTVHEALIAAGFAPTKTILLSLRRMPRLPTRLILITRILNMLTAAIPRSYLILSKPFILRTRLPAAKR